MSFFSDPGTNDDDTTSLLPRGSYHDVTAFTKDEGKTYGAVIIPPSPSSSESSPSSTDPVNERGEGRIVGSAFNLMNAAIGTGILALPYAVRHLGIIVGLVSFACVVVITFFALSTIVRSCIITDRKSYQETALESWGQGLSHIVGAVTMWAKFGTMVASFVIIGNVITPVVEQLFTEEDSRPVILQEKYIVAFSGLAILPVCYPRKINTYRYASILSTITYVYMAGLIMIKSAIYLASEDAAPVPPPLEHQYSIRVMQCIPIVVYAFGCAVQVIPVFDELHDRTLRTMHKVIGGGMGVAFALYVATGIFGYLEFRDDVKGNILLNYPDDDIWVIFGRLLIAFGVALGFPMSSWPFRNSMEQFYLYFRYRRIPRERIVVPHWVNLIETACIVGAALFIAILIPDLSFIFGLLGSTSSVLIGFIIPATMYLKVLPLDKHERHPRVRRAIAIFLLVFGVVVGVMGTYATVNLKN